MEPTETEDIVRYYVFQSVVERVEEHFQQRYDHGVGKEAVFSKHSLGWFIRLRGSWESLFVGMEQPDLIQGDNVQIRIERVRSINHGFARRPSI